MCGCCFSGPVKCYSVYILWAEFRAFKNWFLILSNIFITIALTQIISFEYKAFDISWIFKSNAKSVQTNDYTFLGNSKKIKKHFICFGYSCTFGNTLMIFLSLFGFVDNQKCGGG